MNQLILEYIMERSKKTISLYVPVTNQMHNSESVIANHTQSFVDSGSIQFQECSTLPKFVEVRF